MRLALGKLLHRRSYKAGKVLIALSVLCKQPPVEHLRVDPDLVDLLLLGISRHQRSY